MRTQDVVACCLVDKNMIDNKVQYDISLTMRPYSKLSILLASAVLVCVDRRGIALIKGIGVSGSDLKSSCLQ